MVGKFDTQFVREVRIPKLSWGLWGNTMTLENDIILGDTDNTTTSDIHALEKRHP